MKIDRDRIRAILRAEHSYYGGDDIPIRQDRRWHPDWQNIIAPQLSPTMRVLDVGCGKGHFLLELCASFHTGLGIDHDPEHIQMAEEAKRAEGVQNVDFLLLDYPDEIARLEPESFDMVVSLRGPLTDTAEIQAAHYLLRPDGLLYCEEIAELHQKEVVGIFGDSSHRKGMIPKVDEVKALMERNGFDVRLAADIFTKWIYPDVYAWVQYICNLWTWLGIPLPEPDDPRIALFAERILSAEWLARLSLFVRLVQVEEFLYFAQYIDEPDEDMQAQLGYKIKCIQEDIPYMGFFDGIYSPERPFSL